MTALIIGAGVIAQIHCAALMSLNVTVAGIYDVNPAAARKLADQVGAKTYDDLATALHSDIDFAVVCTPNGTHAALAIQVMEAGKNVVVEKPLALNSEDCDAILHTAQKTGRLCAPISQRRFTNTYRAVRECLQRGELGTPVLATLSMKHYRPPEYYAGTWKGTVQLDGGELMNQGIHGIDLMCGLLGKPAAVSGAVATRYHDIEAEDTAVAHLIFPGGTLGTISSSTAVASKPRRLELCGTQGMIVMEDDSLTHAEGIPLTPEAAPVPQSTWDVTPALHTRSYQNILAAMAGTEALAYTAQDAANTVRVICAIYTASETGRRVEL